MKIKRILVISLSIVLLMLSLTSCYPDNYDPFDFIDTILYGIPIDWPKYEIKGYGYVRLPKNWEISYIDGFAYISSNENGERKLVCVQAEKRLDENTELNDYFPEYESRENLSGGVCSNSAYYRKTKFYYKDGSSKEMWIIESDYVYFDNDDGYIELYFVDDTISRDTVRMIAETLFPYSTYE